MPGGLLNIASYGTENIILTGNPTKTFWNTSYKKYTNLEYFYYSQQRHSRKIIKIF